MKLFIDTANIEEIKEASSWGILSGVTTNPSLIAKEGQDFISVIKEITEYVDGPISAEVTGTNAEEMVEEGKSLSALHPNIVIKVPMTVEGIKAVSALSKEKVKTNVTLIFTMEQALLAARAGATYVSPFVGRLDDIGHDGYALIENIAEVFSNYQISTEIIAASIRHTAHVREAAVSGADIATIPMKVLQQMFKHPLTDAGIAAFERDWKKHLEEMK